MPISLRVLIIEDSEDDLERILLALKKEDYSVTHGRVQTAAELKDALDHATWHLVLSDPTLPELNPPTALAIVRDIDPDLPFVVIPWTSSEELASDLLRISAAAAAARQIAAIVQSSDDAIIGATLEGVITSWNPGAERLFGWTASEAVGQSIDLIIPPHRASEPSRIMAQLSAGENIPPFETERLRRNGSLVPVSLTVSAIWDSKGRLIGAARTGRDLSEIKRTEALLARDALVLANVRDSVIVTDLQGVVTYWNEGAVRLFGWTAAEMLGRPVTEGFPRHVREWVTPKIRSRLGGVEWEGEFQDNRKDGSRVWVDARVTAILDAAGQPVGVLGVSHDITARKQAEEALRRREADYRTLAENLPQLVWATDVEGETEYVSPNWTEYTGLSLDATRQWRWVEAIHPDDRAKMLETWRAALGTGLHYNNEVRLRRRDGEYRWHVGGGVPVREGNSIVRWIGTFMDVEAQKQELFAQAQLAAIVEASDDMIVSTTPDGIVRTWNPGAERALGYSAKEMIGHPIAVIGLRGDEQSPASVLAAVRAGESIRNLSTTRVSKDGDLVDFSLTLTPIRDSEGGVVGIAGISRDITEQGRAQLALRSSEERYRQLADAMPQIVWVTRPDGYHEYYNRQWHEYTGLTYEETRGEGWNRVFHPDDQPLAWEKWRRSLESGEPYEIEYRCRRHDGQYRWFLGRALPQRDADGRILRWLGTCTDVHDFKEAQAVLRDKEAKLAEALRIARMGHWTRDLTTGSIQWSEELYQIFGVKALADGQTLDWFLSMIHPGDRERVRGRISESERTGGSFEHTYRVRRGGGERVIHEVGRVFADSEGRPSRIHGTAQDVTERVQVEAALHLRDRAIRAATQGVLITDASQPDHPIIYVNPAFEHLTGYSAAEALGRNCRFLQGRRTDHKAVERLRRALDAGEACTVELQNYRKDGAAFWNELSISPVRDGSGEITHFIGVQNDVTQRRQLQSQLLQSQKMEGIGQLAGGIAHDFNNMLAVINGYSELVLLNLPEGHGLRGYVGEISKAGDRAAGLTRQLLAFSRLQILETKVLDLNELIVDVDKMVRRLIGEDIELVTLTAPDPLFVKADPGQVEQVLINLAVNARDAMPKGGRLTVATDRVRLQAKDLADHPDAAPGDYVRVAVRDTGSGIPPEVLSQIFEPFFTTKEVGKGTGLGLATVYGIVRQSGGYLAVESELGAGALFSVYLPEVAPQSGEEERPNSFVPSGGTETILVVEDEPMVRAMVVEVLRRGGYQVLEAMQGDEALQMVDAHQGPLDLLISDVVMPKMSGPVLAEELLKRRPGTHVLFISGYTDDAVIRHGVLTQEVELLPKPFGMHELGERVRAILDRRKASAGARSILVVDDSPEQREALSEILRGMGHVVRTARDGREALAELQQDPLPSLILFDLNMPGMNGWVFRQEQLKDPRLCGIPAVAISGWSDPAGAAGYLDVAATLRKPLDIGELLQVVHRELGASQGAQCGDDG